MSGGNPWKPGKPRKDCPLSKVQLILNKITEEKFLPLSLEIRTLFEDQIKTVEHMKGCAEAIFDKAIREGCYTSLYVELCKYLIEIRPSFKSIFLNVVQDKFREILSYDRDRRTKRLIGCVGIISELYNFNIITSKVIFQDVIQRLLVDVCDGNVEALCALFMRVKENIDVNTTSRKCIEGYIAQFRSLQNDKSSNISSRIRFIMLNVLDEYPLKKDT